MTSLNQFVQEELSLLDRKQQRRELPESEPAEMLHMEPSLRYQGRELVNFSSNDYFGLATDPRVVTAALDGLMRFGTGGRASRLVVGQAPAYALLEQRLAAYKHSESCLIFSSGYAANVGTIAALMRAPDLILTDKLAHASLLDGARLSGATLMRFAHNNLQHLEQLLETHRSSYARCLIITESIFSMDGDVAPISDIAALAGAFGAWLMIDDAHGLGLTGHILSPIAALDGVFFSGTLSKAAGSVGGFITGSQVLIDYLKNHARSFVFSTALPPASIFAALDALQVIATDDARTQLPLKHARLFTSILHLPPAQSPIVPVILGDNEKALQASEVLADSGYYVRAIRPPTVPPGTARLRITFTSLHEEAQVIGLAHALKPFQPALPL